MLYDVFDKGAGLLMYFHKPEIIFNGKNLHLYSTNLHACMLAQIQMMPMMEEK